jgi:hypothetical protein
MTAEFLAPQAIFRAWDNNGAPGVGMQLFTYAAGTTTKLASYTDSTGGTPNTNPVVMNARGEAQVWIPPNVGYKFVLAPQGDTDPPSAPVWTVDQITQSQLITLYGGVDTGAVNAYILNFNANFTSLVDGIIIDWFPAHTNTGPSTLNVNSLGAVNIAYQTGSPITAGAIVVNQACSVIYKGGNWLMLTAPNVINTLQDGTAGAPSLSFASAPTTGIYNLGLSGVGFTVNGVAAGAISLATYATSWTGFTAPPSGTIKTGQIGNMNFVCSNSGISGTSNATTMTMNLPPGLVTSLNGGTLPCLVINNGAIAAGTFSVGGVSTINFSVGQSPPNASGFNNTGTKGLPPGFVVMWPAT